MRQAAQTVVLAGSSPALIAKSKQINIMTNTTLAALGAVLLGLMGLALYLTYLSYQKRQRRRKRPLPTGAETMQPTEEEIRAREVVIKAKSSIPVFKNAPPPPLAPDHPYFGLWQHLFNYQNFTESELQGIVQHCDRILLAKEHEDAVLLWERTMMEAVGENSPVSVKKAIHSIKHDRDEYFNASQAWSNLMQKHFGTMVLADVDKAIRSMLEMENKHARFLKAANDRGDSNLALMLEQSQLATKTRQERDQAQAIANDLKAYLDRALAIIAIQNIQINELIRFRGWNGLIIPRDKNGRFAPAPEGMILNVTSTPKVVDEDGVEQERPIVIWVNTGELDADIISFRPRKYSIHNNYNYSEDAVAYCYLRREGGEIQADVYGMSMDFLEKYNDGMIGLFIKANQVSDKKYILCSLSFCPSNIIPSTETRPDNSEAGKQAQIDSLEPRPDHPCLRRCIASLPEHCSCPDGAPKWGEVYFTHSRDYFVSIGLIGERMTITDGSAVTRWAKEKGLKYLGYKDGADGFDIDTFCFTRPAVNSDFDASNSNA